mgnify:CR=1 FL=1
MLELPFKFGKVIDGPFFVNRNKEIAYLKIILLSKINITLISPRRWGKSSLIHKIAKEVEKENKKTIFCFIDLFNSRTEAEFYEYFATQIIKASYSKWDERIDKTKMFFQNIIPKFSFGNDPDSQFSISFDWDSVVKNPNEILDLPEKISKVKNIQLVICLDEFQNISHFNDPLGFQKKARSIWQLHQHCSYILYGSKRNMMSELFENKSMPFYKFGEVMLLQKIENQHWSTYIQRKFKKTKKKISKKNASKIANLVSNHPYFVQQLSNAVWLETKDECTQENIDLALKSLLLQHDLFFIREIESLSNLQLNVLKAIAMDEKVLSNKNTIKKYHLNSSSSISRSKDALVQKEILDVFENKIEFLDPLLKLWIKIVYINKPYEF